MEKEISTIRNKMIAVVCIIAALATWQRDFVISGVMSHLYMNLTILGTFAFGLVTSFLFISKLKNEVIALKALKEMWDDIRVAYEETARDPLRNYRRCLEPARVFRRPRLLGHAYDLVTDELARTKKIRVSIETMNTLVHKIEETISDEKSLIVYLSGLLVFMGLIGTFIGLLHMVGAIGGIIGSLAKSSDGGAASGAFQQLLGALEEPLKGMASGFASSLFGLFSSLVVGLMGRFAGQAANVLKGEFESWLAEVVQLTDDDGFHEKPADIGNGSVAPPNDEALMRMVAAVLKDYARVAGGFELATKLLQEIRAVQSSQLDALTRALDGLADVHSTQTRILTSLDSTGSQNVALKEIGDRVERLGDRIVERLELEGARGRESFQALERAHAGGLRAVTFEQAHIATGFTRALDLLSAEIDRRTSLPSIASIETAIERGLRSGLNQNSGEIALRLNDIIAGAQASIDQFVEREEQRSRKMVESMANQSAWSANISNALELAISNGLARASQTTEAAFAAYASLVHMTVAAIERKNVEAGAQSATRSNDLESAEFAEPIHANNRKA